jgi:arsenate reductase
MKKVLVLCTGNSCRSQIAHAFLAKDLNGIAEVYSAGIETHGVNPKAIATLAEIGIDISAYTSNNVTEYEKIDFDYIITVCDHAQEACPYFPSSAQKIHHNFTDPAKVVGTDQEISDAFRIIRDEIKTFCHKFSLALR